MSLITDNMRKLTYGMYAITAMDQDRPSGCIVNTVFQITSQPAMVAISLNKDNYTFTLIERKKRFGVSILSEETSPNVIAQLGFRSGRDHDKLAGLKTKVLLDTVVLDEHCTGTFLCDVVSMTETSTHFVILGQVVEAGETASHQPMSYQYYHEVIKGSAPKNAPSYIPPEELQKSGKNTKEKYVCSVCGYVHEGDLPEEFQCPVCGVPKSMFKKQ